MDRGGLNIALKTKLKEVTEKELVENNTVDHTVRTLPELSGKIKEMDEEIENIREKWKNIEADLNYRLKRVEVRS